jgi:hypothetical protein
VLFAIVFAALVLLLAANRVEDAEPRPGVRGSVGGGAEGTGSWMPGGAREVRRCSASLILTGGAWPRETIPSARRRTDPCSLRDGPGVAGVQQLVEPLGAEALARRGEPAPDLAAPDRPLD